MSQPFRGGEGRFVSRIWPSVSASLSGERIVIESALPLQSLSSAVYNGGAGAFLRFVNWKVPLSYRCSNPAEDMRGMLRQWGYPPEETVGLMTAAKLTHASFAEHEGDRCLLFCCTTAGTGNAARAGVDRQSFPAYYEPGTINTFLLIDGQMSPSAMVNAIMTATEAKAAALAALGVTDPASGLHATGTTTDTVVVGVSQSGRFGGLHAYAGTATTIGNAIGRIVYDTVYEAVATQKEE